MNKKSIYRTLRYGFVLLLIICTLIGCESADTELTEIEYAGLSCVIVEEKNSDKIMKIYQQMQEEGAKEGYYPLIILRDEQITGGRSVLDEWLEMQAENYDSLDEYVQELLDKYSEIDAEDYFERMNESYLEWESIIGNSDIADLSGVEQLNELYISYTEDIYIAKVPTDKPYEVLAYIPMGGFNECPPTEQHIAIAKKWYEEYGAVPCAVSYDTVQYYLDTPATGDEVLEELKKEQFMYCQDIVTQGSGSLENLKQSIKGSKFWFFWWD